jgi:hypothetical protein
LRVHPALPRLRTHLDEWTARVGISARKFQRIDTPWLAAVTYPDADPRLLRLAHDWMAWLIAFDDSVDDTALGHEVDQVRLRTGALLVARTGAPDDPLDRGFANLWSRLSAAAPARWLDMFESHVREYFDSYLWEAGNRRAKAVPEVAEYLENRLNTGAVQTCFDLTLLTCGGDPATRTERVLAAERLASRVISLTNDLASYHKERRLGDVHNLVVILIEREGLAHAQACAEVLARIEADLAAFEDLVGVDGYAEGLRSWMVGNHEWSLRSRRFQPAG